MKCIKVTGSVFLLVIASSITNFVNAQEQPSVDYFNGKTIAPTFSLASADGRLAPGRKINLVQEAKITASHKTVGYKIEDAFDGNLKTQWVGEGHPLPWQPTNIIIEFNEPKTIERLVIVSTKIRNLLALKDLEIYAWGDKTWAGTTPLAVVLNTKEETNTIDFQPVTTRSLRIRIRDTYYFNSFPRILEMEVYESSPGT